MVVCAVALSANEAGAAPAAKAKKGQSQIQTVLGPVPASKFGMALTHEHVLCDFIGADKTARSRWNAEEVIRVMRPYLEQAREKGVRGFVDCTPAYIGRDPLLLKRLAKETGLHILTNTGYYGAAGDKYLPKHAFTESADELAARWIREWEQGIEGTGVRPGFIKIGVDPAESSPPGLSEVDAKLVRAAARAHRRTGLTIASHTVQGQAALEHIRILESEGVDPKAYIYVHAHGEPDQKYHFEAAAKGVWISYDGLNAGDQDQHVRWTLAMLAKYPDRLLLSHDAGWYQAGEPVQKARDFNYLIDGFLPALREAGASEADIRRLTVLNPAKAFAVKK
ncbi:MAG: phosphotriesterase [Armatimonadetes bacterium]|nr:phosphotriesterase [Armatimonadota bacterium]